MKATITFISHGQAEMPTSSHHEKDCKLSDFGIQQARRCRKKLENPEYELVLTAPTAFCAETGAIIAGDTYKRSTVDLGELYPAHSSADTVAIAAIYRNCGNASLDEQNEAGVYTQPIMNLALLAWIAIKTCCEAVPGAKVLVVGPAMLLPAIGIIANTPRTNSVTRILRGTRLRDCEGYTLTLSRADQPDCIEMHT
jgi:hypothetical protein